MDLFLLFILGGGEGGLGKIEEDKRIGWRRGG
jgi:hypothetical protein